LRLAKLFSLYHPNALQIQQTRAKSTALIQSHRTGVSSSVLPA
jgi:hypothetical protein